MASGLDITSMACPSRSSGSSSGSNSGGRSDDGVSLENGDEGAEGK